MAERATASETMSVWAQPDGAAPIIATLPAGYEAEVIEAGAYGWTRVVVQIGGVPHEGWVDGRLLVAASAGAPSRAGQLSNATVWLGLLGILGVATAVGAVAFFLVRGDSDPAGTTPEEAVEAILDVPTPAASPAFEPTTPASPSQEDTTVPTAPAGDDPSEDATPADTSPTDSGGATGFLGDDAVQAAIAQVATEPVASTLPPRDDVVTELLRRELVEGGHDLTGVDLVVYPQSEIGSFLVLATTDDSPMLNPEEDDDGGETLVFDLLESRAVTEHGVERIVIRHDTVDDDGPIRITISITIADLLFAIDTEGDVFSLAAVQTERP